MQLLKFDTDSLQRWARFSGDFNPIHFDDEFANQAVGQGGVVVHGMLAMLSIKACQRDIDLGMGDWFEWRAMLRRAMPLRSAYMIESRGAAEGANIRFRLTATDDAEAKITGAFSLATPPSTALYTGERFAVDVATVQSELAYFLELFPTSSAAWMAFDAFAFARYIRYHAKTAFQEDLRQHFGDEYAKGMPGGGLVTMQTHHADCFAKSMLRPAAAMNFSCIEYALLKSDELQTADSLFATIDIPIWIDGVLVQVVKLGLMARKTPSITSGERSQ